MTLPDWFPKCSHPITGEQFLPNFDVTIDSNNKIVTYYAYPPDAPGRSYCAADGWWYTRNDEQFKKACAEYIELYTKWVESGCLVGEQVGVVKGQATISGKFSTKSGATVKGSRPLENGEWIWNEISTYE